MPRKPSKNVESNEAKTGTGDWSWIDIGSSRSSYVRELSEKLLIELTKSYGKCNPDMPQMVVDRANQMADLLGLKD